MHEASRKGQRNEASTQTGFFVLTETDRVRNVLIQIAGTNFNCNWLVFISLIAYRLKEICIEFASQLMWLSRSTRTFLMNWKSSSHRYSCVRRAVASPHRDMRSSCHIIIMKNIKLFHLIFVGVVLAGNSDCNRPFLSLSKKSQGF